MLNCVMEGEINTTTKACLLVNKGNKGIESTVANNHRINIANRRTTVWGYVCKGMQINDIACNLGVDKSTISKDIKFLVRDSQKYLNDMAKQTLPFMYRQSIEGMQQILLECWARHRKDGNLFALRLALDCHKEIFNQAANGVSVLAVKKITEKANALGIE
jgi:hypothetical protein